MKEILFKDVVPYMQIWSSIILVVLIVLTYQIWRFSKKYPQIFMRDTTADSKQHLQEKAELRRIYHNKTMSFFVFVFVWMLGMFAICYGFAPDNRSLYVSAIAFMFLLLVVSMMQRKPKK